MLIQYYSRSMYAHRVSSMCAHTVLCALVHHRPAASKAALFDIDESCVHAFCPAYDKS